MNRDILEAAERAQPEMMQKVALSLSLIEKMAPEFMEDILRDFETVSEVTTEKIAAAPEAVRKTAIGVAASIGAGVAASLGTALAADFFDIAKRGLTKSRNFKRIMKYNPQLKNEVSDPARLKPAFDALHRYAPDFTADPMLGASLLKSLANQPPGNEYQLITNLIGSRKNLVDIEHNQFKLDLREPANDAANLLTGNRKHKERVELESAKQAPIHYHQHFHGKDSVKGSRTPIAPKGSSSTP